MVAALAVTSGVAIALHAHSGSVGVAAATSALAPATPVHATVEDFLFSSNDFKIDSEKAHRGGAAADHHPRQGVERVA
jgi:hypothetical protein